MGIANADSSFLKKQRVSVFPRVIPFSNGVWQSGRGRLDPSSLSGSEPRLESSFGGSAVAHKESFDAFETIARRISGNGRRGGERGLNYFKKEERHSGRILGAKGPRRPTEEGVDGGRYG